MHLMYMYRADVLSVITTDSEQLEKIQLIAAKIVTGLLISASRESLYFERVNNA